MKVTCKMKFFHSIFFPKKSLVGIKQKARSRILAFLRRLSGTNPVTPEMIRKRGGVVGERCAIYTHNIDCAHANLLTIGDDCTISNARILLHDASTMRDLGYSKVGRVTIGNKVFVGAGAIILPNVRIGDNVIIGAGSVVTKDIPGNSIVACNPAKVIGSYDVYIEKNRESMKTAHLFNTSHSKRTIEQLKTMRSEVQQGSFGYEKGSPIL